MTITNHSPFGCCDPDCKLPHGQAAAAEQEIAISIMRKRNRRARRDSLRLERESNYWNANVDALDQIGSASYYMMLLKLSRHVPPSKWRRCIDEALKSRMNIAFHHAAYDFKRFCEGAA